MIVRTWRGWTTPDNADAYERLLKSEVFRGIAAKSMAGYQRIELLRRDLGEEVEFMTMMRFASLDDVKQFMGEDYEQAYVPAEARRILKRFDARSQHYELRESIDYSSRAA
jgi:heme-degrading monooxygenase HmoA